MAFLHQELFDKAAEDAKALPDKTSNDDKLSLYGLFKQATVGDVNTGVQMVDLALVCKCSFCCCSAEGW